MRLAGLRSSVDALAVPATMDTIPTTQKVLHVDGVSTELCFMEFADRFFVVVTQLNKPGTLVRCPARRPPPLPPRLPGK